MGQWISTADRMPDEREPVLLWMPVYGECRVAVGFRRRDEEYDGDGNLDPDAAVNWYVGGTMTSLRPSHWMPLPPGPLS